MDMISVIIFDVPSFRVPIVCWGLGAFRWFCIQCGGCAMVIIVVVVDVVFGGAMVFTRFVLHLGRQSLDKVPPNISTKPRSNHLILASAPSLIRDHLAAGIRRGYRF